MKINPALYNYIKKLTLKAKFLSSELFVGEYESAFKGRGIEFEEVREYQFGDDVKTIDWNTSARSGKLFVKQFHEEREITVIIVVDISKSMKFGSKWKLKSELAAEISALLSYTAIKSNDKVGLILFGNEVKKIIPPKKGRHHIWKIIKEIVSLEFSETKSDFQKTLKILNQLVKRKSVVFFISDFIGEFVITPFKSLKNRFDFVPIIIRDPLEEELKLENLNFIFKDPESNIQKIYNFKEFKNIHHSLERLIKEFRKIDLMPIKILTNEPYLIELIKFFRRKK